MTYRVNSKANHGGPRWHLGSLTKETDSQRRKLPLPADAHVREWRRRQTPGFNAWLLERMRAVP